MKKPKVALVALMTLLVVISSCNNKVNKNGSDEAGKMIAQQNDGSFLLKLEEAACYSDQLNPASNTAEWKFVVPKPGRYKVWLCSETRDTNKLSYLTPVKISILDSHLERSPECDKIVRNSAEVAFPYFRTESYMGTFYIPEPGEYNIQIISEKVTNKENQSQNQLIADNTKLMSLILVPMTR
jgi:hypothetical protein